MPNVASSVSREITLLCRTLRAMDRALHRLGPKPRKAVVSTGLSRRGRAGRKLRLSPKRRAQLKLQGKYMGYLKSLKPKQKAEVRNLLQRKGMSAAIAKAQKFMRRERAA